MSSSSFSFGLFPTLLIHTWCGPFGVEIASFRAPPLHVARLDDDLALRIGVEIGNDCRPKKARSREVPDFGWIDHQLPTCRTAVRLNDGEAIENRPRQSEAAIGKG